MIARHLCVLVLAAPLLVSAADDAGTSKMSAAKSAGKSVSAKQLEKYDANKNGVLDPAEKELMRKDAKERRAEVLKKYDKNGDGKLDSAERQQQRDDAKKERQEMKAAKTKT